MPKIDTILFDWDGTLAQTLEVWLKTFREAYAAVGLDLNDSEIGAQFGNWQAHIELGVKPEDEATYKKHLESVYNQLDEVALYKGARDVLKKLRLSGYKLGLVSTSNRRMIDNALVNNDLSALFDITIAAEDTVKHKPDPEPLLTAVKLLESTTASTMFVGDSDKDTGAATNAEIDLLLFLPSSHGIYYDLEKLQQEPCVKAAFAHWKDFPFESIT